MSRNVKDLSDYLSLSDKVYRNIKLDILNSYLEPGERITETHLSKIMKVSKAPIKDALNKLEKDGFVTIIPRKGTIVKRITIRDIDDIFEIREMIEPLLLIKSIDTINFKDLEYFERKFRDFLDKEVNEKNKEEYSIIDQKFHKLFNKNCKNNKIIKLFNDLYEKIYWFRKFSIYIHSFKRRSVYEHLAIIDAIKKKDKLSVIKELIKHLRNTKKSIITELKTENKKNANYTSSSEYGILEILQETIEQNK